MKLGKIVFLSALFILFPSIIFIVYAQGVLVSPPADNTVVTSDSQPVVQERNDTRWAWGAVINLDIEAKTVTIKYLDYETDQEKDLLLVIDDKTAFENVKGLEEIKTNDTLSVDYAVGPDSRNIAKNISLEKPDSLPPVPVSAPEVKVSEEQPVTQEAAAVEQSPAPVEPAQDLSSAKEPESTSISTPATPEPVSQAQ